MAQPRLHRRIAGLIPQHHHDGVARGQVIGREGQKDDDEEDRDQAKNPARNIDAHPRHPLRPGISGRPI